MQANDITCTRYVGNKTVCRYCNGNCIKHGRYGGKQRYRCGNCKRTFINSYTYNACKQTTNTWITRLVKEGSGIRSIARLLEISCTTVLKRILSIAKSIQKPAMALGKMYEVDEIRAFYKSKTRLIWIVYALRCDTKQIADFVIGRRTVKTNHIERRNLTLRTHLKRLNKITICFFKNLVILAACLKIYFWV